jgi:anthranilate synthase component 2
MKTLVIDNYDSFVYNLVQYVGELGGKPIVYRNDQLSLSLAEKLEPERIIISPGPGTPVDPKYFGVCKLIIEKISTEIPTLGICLGCQGIVHAFGGNIVGSMRLMHGKTSMIKHDGKGIFNDTKNPMRATRYHSLVAEKTSIPDCLKITAEAMDDHEIMGVRHIYYPIEGLQFHPESIMTEDGKKIIKNFLEGM